MVCYVLVTKKGAADMMHFTNKPKRTDLLDRTAAFDNDVWKVIGVGVTDADGFVFLHLASTTRFRQQRNGKVPVQMSTFMHPDIFAFAESLA